MQSKVKVLFRNNNLEIRYLKKYKCIEWEWNSPALNVEHKKLLNKVYEKFVAKKCDKINNVMQKIGVIPQEIQDFVEQDWLPRMIEAGLKHVALVVPISASADITVETIKEKVEDLREDKGVDERTFSTIEDARSWIASLP